MVGSLAAPCWQVAHRAAPWLAWWMWAIAEGWLHLVYVSTDCPDTMISLFNSCQMWWKLVSPDLYLGTQLSPTLRYRDGNKLYVSKYLKKTSISSLQSYPPYLNTFSLRVMDYFLDCLLLVACLLISWSSLLLPTLSSCWYNSIYLSWTLLFLTQVLPSHMECKILSLMITIFYGFF